MGMEPILYHMSLVLNFRTFRVSYTYSGTNYVWKLETARTSNTHYQKKQNLKKAAENNVTWNSMNAVEHQRIKITIIIVDAVR